MGVKFNQAAFMQDAFDSSGTEIFALSTPYVYTKTPMWKTLVSTAENGVEQRRSKWSKPVHRFDLTLKNMLNRVGYEEISKMYNFFLAHRAAYTAFYFADVAHDYGTIGESIGTGDAATSAFQLKKAYTFGSLTYTDNKKYILPTSETIYVAGSPKTLYTNYIINYDTGIITFVGGSIPTAGQVITADFQFYYQVRFANDMLSLEMFAYLLANATVSFVEVF